MCHRERTWLLSSGSLKPWTLRTSTFRGLLPTARTLAHLRIAEPVAVPLLHTPLHARRQASLPTCMAALVGRDSHPPDDASVFPLDLRIFLSYRPAFLPVRTRDLGRDGRGRNRDSDRERPAAAVPWPPSGLTLSGVRPDFGRLSGIRTTAASKLARSHRCAQASHLLCLPRMSLLTSSVDPLPLSLLRPKHPRLPERNAWPSPASLPARHAASTTGQACCLVLDVEEV